MEISHNHGHAAAVHAAHAAAQAQAASPAPQPQADPAHASGVHGPAVVLGGAFAAAQGGPAIHNAVPATQVRPGASGVYA